MNRVVCENCNNEIEYSDLDIFKNGHGDRHVLCTDSECEDYETLARMPVKVPSKIEIKP